MNKAIYHGSFDPMTKGHIDVIEKALHIFDEIYVVVAINPDKKHMFDILGRTNMVDLSLSNIKIPENKKIFIVSYEGIISNLAKELKVNSMIRGMRNAHDMQDEYAIEQFTENSTDKEVITVYFSPRPEHIFTSSTLVRNFIKGGFFEKCEKYIDKNVFEYLKNFDFSYSKNNKYYIKEIEK
jgi:pantetheine-phosphate adenylyltransferase